MKNFSVEIDGQTRWISRSVAACTFVFKILNNKLLVLVERRGKGAADEKSKLCACCGYLDYDETLPQCAVREIREETGFIANEKKLRFMGINSDPSEKYQNVTVHYVYFAKPNEDFNPKNAVGGETNEVEEVFWMEVGEFSGEKILRVNIYDIVSEDWAFGHERRMLEHLREFFVLKYEKEETKDYPN